MDLRACIRCGSHELRMPGIRDGVIVGEGQELSRWTCRACGLTAVPLLFDSEEARAAYAEERAKDPSKDWPPTGWPSLKKPGA